MKDLARGKSDKNRDIWRAMSKREAREAVIYAGEILGRATAELVENVAEHGNKSSLAKAGS
jgi:hypothetical protein